MTSEAPGKPWNPLLSLPMVCTSPSCIKVDWTFPHVPKHGIFCSGLGTPNDCPVTMCVAAMHKCSVCVCARACALCHSRIRKQ